MREIRVIDLGDEPYRMGWTHGSALKVTDYRKQGEEEVRRKLDLAKRDMFPNETWRIAYVAGCINGYRYTK